MAGRRLDPDEAALWAKVIASVNPIRHPVIESGSRSDEPLAVPARVPTMPKGRIPKARIPVNSTTQSQTRQIEGNLDGGWERRIGRGQIIPDTSVDLHGHTLASAYSLLDQALEQAVARGNRILLLITGRPPRAESERPHARGAIRAAVNDWLAASRHADHIAAVRNAHPRHGGNGALYLILRREKRR